MAILINDVTPYARYTATAGQTLFTVPFEFFNESDLIVLVNDVTLTYSPTPADQTQYSVTGANQEGGGSITLGAPGASLDDDVVIYRAIPIARSANYPETGPMAIASLNTEQAKHIGIMQQLQREADRAVLLPLGEAGFEIPSAAERASKVLSFDANGDLLAADATTHLAPLGAFGVTLVENATAAGALDDLGLSASSGSSEIGFIQSGTGAVATTAQEKNRRQVSAFDFLSAANKAAARAGTITEAAGTAAVQAAIDSLPATVGGHVHIEDGVKFNLQSLTPPASNRLTMSYRVDDDQSTGLPGSGLASNERVFFSSSSSYPTDPTGAIVNEYRYTATFHPGFITDVRKDLTSLAAPGLAPSQSMTNPVRNSWNIHDEQLPTFRIVYQNYETFDTYSGTLIHNFRRQNVLTGVGTSGWAVAPLVNHRVRGSTSGAKGFVKAIDASSLTIEWFKGRFVVGETLVNETVAATSSGTITGGTSIAEDAMSFIGQDLYKGAWTVGDRPPAAGSEILNISGNVKLVPTRGSSFVQPKTVTKPTVKFGGDPESPGFHEMGIQYDPALTYKRLAVVDTSAETWRGQLMPVQAACTFDHSTSVTTNSVNIESIVLYGTGQYQFFYDRDVARAGVMTFATIDGFSGTSVVGWRAQVTSRALDNCFVEIRDSSGNLANIPSGAWGSLLIIGGDIT